jgi:uncharacterized protein (TIGR02246 family)
MRKRMSTTTMTADETAVFAALDGFYAAWAAYDPDQVARYYARDATAIVPGGMNRGRGEVRNFFAAGFQSRLKDTTVIDESRYLRFPADGTAVVVTEGGILAAGEKSVPAERLVRGTYVLVRQDGEWLITSFHSCPLHAS